MEYLSLMVDVTSAVKKTIEKFGMIRPGETVVAAVSGGVDSVVMLDALDRLRHDLGFELAVCHLDHGLRGEESQRDLEFVRDLADRRNLPFHSMSLPPGELEEVKGVSVQVAARARRYEFFTEAVSALGADRVALGHTLDDQAETVLMRFIKGSSLSGLSGIPPVRSRFIRPLIDTSRADIESHAADHRLDFVEDSSNSSDKYLRNDIRLNLMPFLEERFNPRVKEGLARAATTLAKDEEFLKRQANSIFPTVVTGHTPTGLVFDRVALADLHDSLLARVFIIGIDVLSDRSELHSQHVESFIQVVIGDNPSAVINLPGGLTIERQYDRVIVSAEEREERKSFDHRLRLSGTTEIEETGGAFKVAILRKPPETFEGSSIAYFDYDKLPRPVRIRSFIPGDRMAPLGMGGSRKKLKEIFIENRVPKSARSAVPLVIAGGEILWAAGIRRSNLYMVEDTTARILRVEYTSGTAAEPESVDRPPRPEYPEESRYPVRPKRPDYPHRSKRKRKKKAPELAPAPEAYIPPPRPVEKEEKAHAPIDAEEAHEEAVYEGVLGDDASALEWVDETEAAEREDESKPAGRGRRGRRGRRGGRGRRKTREAAAEDAVEEAPKEEKAEGAAGEGAEGPGEEKPKRPRRRRGRRRTGKQKDAEAAETEAAESTGETAAAEGAEGGEGESEDRPRRPRRRRGRRRSAKQKDAESAETETTETSGEAAPAAEPADTTAANEGESEDRPKRPRRRRGGRGRSSRSRAAEGAEPSEGTAAEDKPAGEAEQATGDGNEAAEGAPKRPRRRRGGRRRSSKPRSAEGGEGGENASGGGETGGATEADSSGASTGAASESAEDKPARPRSRRPRRRRPRSGGGKGSAGGEGAEGAGGSGGGEDSSGGGGEGSPASSGGENG